MKETPKNANMQSYDKALELMRLPLDDIKEVTKLLKQAWSEGDARAAYALGTWYFHGANGIKQNKNIGIELIKAAAQKKIPAAMFDLATIYTDGTSIERNLEKSFFLFLDAAIRGDAEAVFEVSRCYFYGIGVTQDREIAEIWAARAEELGTYLDK